MKKTQMFHKANVLALSVLAIAMAAPAQAIQSQGFYSPPALSYADLADLSIPAPIVADAIIAKATRMKGADAATVAPGHQRYYVEANIQKLIRGPSGLSPRQGYVVDVPFDSMGRVPKLKKMRVILFARAVPGRPGILQLVTADSQIAWNEERDRMVRAILTESIKPGAAPALSSINRAFYVPGNVPGHSDTQIFVDTATGVPISLNVRRRPGQIAKWGVALGDVVGSESLLAPGRTLCCGTALRVNCPHSSLSERLRAEMKNSCQRIISLSGPALVNVSGRDLRAKAASSNGRNLGPSFSYGRPHQHR